MASDCRTGRGRATGPAWAMSTSVNSAKRAIMDGLKIIQVKFELRPVTVQGQILVLQLLTSRLRPVLLFISPKNQPAGLELHKQRVHMLCGPPDAGYRMAGG